MRIVQWTIILLVTVSVIIDSGYAQSNDSKCPSTHFECANGQCIDGTLLCDGTANCIDLSDETKTKCEQIQCPSYVFRCDYGACIDKDGLCNGIQDCVDNSDETQPQCNNNTTNSQNKCLKYEFMCNNGQCISDTDVCDGYANCQDTSDETASLCQSIDCNLAHFHCTYGACIDGDLKCNGQIDCIDGSDEDSKLCKSEWSTVGTRPTSTVQTSNPFPHTSTSCRIPPQPENGSWKLHSSQCPGNENCNVPLGTRELRLGSRLIYSCNKGYKIVNGLVDVTCIFGGEWLNIPVCEEIHCVPINSPSITAICRYDGVLVPCGLPALPLTRAEVECANSYHLESNTLYGRRQNVECNTKGQWVPDIIKCVPDCGVLPHNVKPTSIHGYLANITEFPWHATLYRDEEQPKQFFCGASIVQPNLLITAAHCIYNDNTRQLMNPNDIYILTGNFFREYHSAYHNETLVKSNQVKRIFIKRNYFGILGNYILDIAILEVVKPFELSAFLVPICLGDGSNDWAILEPGISGKVAGFGLTEYGTPSQVLQALTVPLISESECRSASQTVNLEHYLTEDKICAGFTNGSSVCDGDSGGGLVFKRKALWYLRGIVSTSLGTITEGGKSRCNNNLYSLYTDVSRHIEWIRDVMFRIEHNQTSVLCSEQYSTRCS